MASFPSNEDLGLAPAPQFSKLATNASSNLSALLARFFSPPPPTAPPPPAPAGSLADQAGYNSIGKLAGERN